MSIHDDRTMYSPVRLYTRQVALTYDDVQIVPMYSDVVSRELCSVHTQFTRTYSMKIPIVSAPMDTVTGLAMAKFMRKVGGVGVIHRFCDIETQATWVQETHKVRGSSPTCASIGVGKDDTERFHTLADAGVQVVLIDVANGHHKNVIEMLRYCKSEQPNIDVIVGNVATREAYDLLVNNGADAVRVGIGGGSLCETRIRTGVGLPNITTISMCSVPLSGETRVPIIADGGIRYAGDVAKALGAGAQSVMLGSMLAGTEEASGTLERVGFGTDQQLVKTYRGSASASQKKSDGKDVRYVEGNSTHVRYKGDAQLVVTDILDGLRSAMSYVGVTNLKDFSDTCQFVRVTASGATEAKPHLL